LGHLPGDDMVHLDRPLRRDASFEVEGVTCRAWVYEPVAETTRPAPCIVMAHGLGGIRDAALEPYAVRFAAAGFAVVLFDYRYLGASDGEPRQLISPRRQLEDWQAAVAFARALPGVDPARIGLWGCSLSGGHVMVIAATDAGIAAVMAQCPMLEGIASARMAMQRAGILGSLRMAGAVIGDLARAATGRAPRYVPLAARSGQLGAMASDTAYEGCLAIAPPGWRNEVAARIFLTLPLYRPMRYVRRVACPTLLIACANDTIVSAGAAARAAVRTRKPARLVVLPIDHFDIYRDAWFETSCSEQVAFLKEAMQGGAGGPG